MEFKTFVQYAEEIEDESGNNKKEILISNLLLKADDDMSKLPYPISLGV